MKKSCFFLLVLLVGIPGCGDKKKVQSQEPRAKKSKKTIMNEVNIPVAGQTIKSFFDEDIEEFHMIDDPAANKNKTAVAVATEKSDDFSWVADLENENDFKTVYFDFDKYNVREDQTTSVEHDILVAKEMLAKGESPTIIIEGHACHSAGSRTYNLALSERRAKLLSDQFVAAGVPRENIKLVPRGAEVAARDKHGAQVTGNREQQWPNRRDEIRVLYS